MTERIATCQCGQLAVTCRGEPVRVSVCHCLDCQKRSGASFAAQARFAVSDATTRGESSVWVRISDEGKRGEFHFCPACGSTVWYCLEIDPDMIAVAVGAFADPTFPPPIYSVYEGRKHAWVAIVGEGIEHID